MNSEQRDEAMRERWEKQEAKEKEDRRRTLQYDAEVERIHTFTPREFSPGLWTFLITTRPCAVCKKPTAPNLAAGPFPAGIRIDFEAQRARAGIRLLHHWGDKGPVCSDCKLNTAETFECSHCKQSKPLNESHKSFGAPAEHLCAHCYETVPAKQWEGLVAELEEQHRYDF